MKEEGDGFDLHSKMAHFYGVLYSGHRSVGLAVWSARKLGILEFPRISACGQISQLNKSPLVWRWVNERPCWCMTYMLYPTLRKNTVVLDALL